MDELIWRWKHFGGWAAGAIGAVLAWFAGFDLVAKLALNAPETLVAVTYLVVFTCAIFLFCAYRIWVTIKKERYANISRQLHSIMHQLRDLQTYIASKEPSNGDRQAYETFLGNCRMMFGGVLDQVNAVFTSLTSNNCRAAIKLLYPHNGELYVYTLTRDRAARQDCVSLDNTRVSGNRDPLNKNFQFARLFNGQEECWHFASNNLTTEKNFKTTSAAAYNDTWDSDISTKRRPWPLPYRSTITCVIRQARFDFFPEHDSEVLGYLAVDCQSRGVFEFRWDVELLFAIADSMYAPIQAYLAAQSRAVSASPGGARPPGTASRVQMVAPLGTKK